MLAAVSRPARSAASTSATSPPMRTRYLPRGTMVVSSRSTEARFIIASVASMPRAMELVSSIAMAGPNESGFFTTRTTLRGVTSRPGAWMGCNTTP